MTTKEMVEKANKFLDGEEDSGREPDDWLRELGLSDPRVLRKQFPAVMGELVLLGMIYYHVLKEG